MISIQHIYKGFQPQQFVLNDVSFAIETGEKCCIIGKSGVGKSVLMKLILGLEKIEQGDITIDNQSIKYLREREWRNILQKFGVVFQGSALFDSLTISENIGLKLYEEKLFSKAEIHRKVVDALQKVGLSDAILAQKPDELSGGMKKRVAIARAILHNPSYLLYDEPTTGLDPQTSDLIDDLMKNLATETGRTSIIITHDLATVRNVADKVVFLHHQKVHFWGEPQALFESKDAEIQNFLRRYQS